MRRRIGSVIFVFALVLTPVAAGAAPGGGKGGGNGAKGGGGDSVSVPDGVYGGTTVATVAKAKAGTWVLSTCFQDGYPVIFNRLEVDESGRAVMELGPTDGYVVGIGGADCDAEAKYWHLKRQTWVSMGSTTFHVSD